MKIAIFHCEEIPTLFLLENAAKKAGFETFVFHFRDIRLSLNNGDIDIKVGDVSLKDFSIIFCRGFWNYQNEVALLAQFCRAHKINLFDSALLTRHTISKMYDLVCFERAGLPVPKTIFSDQLSSDFIAKELKFPLVAKEDRSRQGRNVFLLEDKQSLEKFIADNKVAQKSLDTPMYQFQEFIPADFDVRVIVIGGKVVGAIKRQSRDPAEFRHNISLGGIASEIKISAEMEKMAILAAKSLNFEFGGADFIANKKTGEIYILEVNRSPGFEGFIAATGIDVPHALMQFFLRFSSKPLQ